MRVQCVHQHPPSSVRTVIVPCGERVIESASIALRRFVLQRVWNHTSLKLDALGAGVDDPHDYQSDFSISKQQGEQNTAPWPQILEAAAETCSNSTRLQNQEIQRRDCNAHEPRYGLLVATDA